MHGIAKRLFIILSTSSLLLTACGGEDATGEPESGGAEARYFTYKTSEYGIEIPDDWETVENFVSEYPNELQAAFRNNVQNTDFTSNVTVLKEANTKKDTSYDYAERKLAEHESTLLNYELLSQEVVSLSVNGAESKTLLSTFQGKNDTSRLSLQFLQVTLANGEDAWVVTATYRPNEDEFVIERMDHMLRSFTLR